MRFNIHNARLVIIVEEHHSVELNRYIMLGPENDKQKVLFI
jgi:hypothetical protein